jgi:hypothetical protein
MNIVLARYLNKRLIELPAPTRGKPLGDYTTSRPGIGTGTGIGIGKPEKLKNL